MIDYATRVLGAVLVGEMWANQSAFVADGQKLPLLVA
jgi:hypothetical protein